LAYFNSCVNPIIYNRTSKDFRDAFHAALWCNSGATVGLDEHHASKRRPPPAAKDVGVLTRLVPLSMIGIDAPVTICEEDIPNTEDTTRMMIDVQLNQSTEAQG